MLGDDYKIGFLWGNGAMTQHSFRVCFRDEKFLSALCRGNRKIRPYRHHAKNTFVLFIPLQSEIICKLMSLGWTGRADKQRCYPQGEFNELDFIRGYCKTKLNMKKQKITTKAYGIYYTICLRIYGSIDIVEKIDRYLCATIGMKPKKIQQSRCKVDQLYDGSTHYVSYASRHDCEKILRLLGREVVGKNDLL